MSDVLTAIGTTFTVDGARLLDAIAVVKKAHKGSGDKQARLQFDASADGLMLSALVNWRVHGDQTVVDSGSLSATVRVDGTVTEPGLLAVPLDLLVKFLGPYTAAKLRKNPLPVVFTASAGEVSVKAGNRERVLSAPPVTVDPLGFDVTCSTTVHSSVLAETVIAASTEEARPILTGVFFDKQDVVATDSYRMHVVRGATEVGENSVLVPRTLANLAASAGGDLFMEWGSPWVPLSAYSERRVVQFTDAATGVVWRALDIDGEFPNYRGLMNASPEGRWTFDVAELREAIRVLQAGGFKSNGTRVQRKPFKIHEGDTGTVDVSISDDGLGTETHRITGTSDTTFGLNIEYLADLVAFVEQPTITAKVDPQKPTEFWEPRSQGGERFRLLMPVRLP